MKIIEFITNIEHLEFVTCWLFNAGICYRIELKNDLYKLVIRFEQDDIDRGKLQLFEDIFINYPED